jgi:ferredoxin
MDSHLRSQVVFHLTGRRPAPEAPEGAVKGLRPALMAAYRDLDSLRHDFPVVFCGGEDCLQSLSSVVDRALRKLAPEGVQGEALRRRVLKVEREIRRSISAGVRGRLGELWDRATDALAAQADEGFARDAHRAKGALGVDGEVAGCDGALPGRFMRHAWSEVQREKSRAARERIDSLVIRLDEILRADYMRSERALQQPALKASFGGAHHGLFDFAAMARVLKRAGPQSGLGDRRRSRIEQAKAELAAQRFFAPGGRTDGQGEAGGVLSFSFDEPAAALAAFRERLPELVELLKALQVAELEVEGNYREELHDPILAALEPAGVTDQDLRFFPDYLVCLAGRERGEPARLAQALSSGVPLKVLVQVEDLLEESSPGKGQFTFGLRGAQLASVAMSFDEVFVLQSVASNLLQLRDRVRKGLRHAGPALFSIYAGPAGGTLPAYLVSAAAMQSRAFPAFTYDPAAGPDLASRYSLENNPQPEHDWPVEKFSYADQDLQSVTEEVAFTFVDFVACDPRYAGHFAPAPRASWGDSMIPVRDWLENPPQDAASGVPYVLAVDDADLLCRLVVDDRLIRSAIRCREGWHRMQELGGIRDSRAERLLARERQAWEEEHQRELRAVTAAAGATPVTATVAQPAQATTDLAAAAPAAATVEAAEPARNPDEPYIETLRCSTCNECTQLNPRMFAYNENKQAYIADLKAGTYAQMVQAAESCQVSVIHPGKPWDETEPGLAELIERAKPFL